MSGNGQAIGAVVGGVVGFVASAGNPAGALQGASYGAAIGGALDPPPGPDQEGPRIDDLGAQTSSYGAAVANINGTIGVKGHMIWVENGQIKEVVKEEESESGGKGGGGGGGTTTTYSYNITCAIVLTDHEIDGIGRLFFGPNLVSNAFATDLSTAAASGDVFPTLHLQASSTLLKASLNTNPVGGTVRLYPGYDDQPADPRMAADLGAGNCPAYRGYTVLFLYDYPLKDYGNSAAGIQVKAELIRDSGAGDFVLLRSDITDRINSVSDVTPAANYVWPDESVVLSPQWFSGFSAPVSSSIKKINYGLDGASRDGSYPVSGSGPGPFEDGEGPGYLQRGITDDPDFYTTGAFDGTIARIGNFVGFTDSGGRFFAREDEYVGTSWVSFKRGIFRWTGKSMALAEYLPLTQLTVAVTMDESFNVFASESGTVRKYDTDLAELANKTLVFDPPSTVDFSIGDSFIHWDSGFIYFIFGRQARYVHVMPDDFSTDPVYLGDIGASPHGEASTSELAVGTAVTIKNGILTRFVSTFPDYATSIDRWRLPTLGTGGQLLAQVVRERMERSELIEPADIDVTLLTDTVTGYATSGITSIRSAISPLMAGYNFDLIESGYQLKPIPRGQSSVMTIDYDDLDARPFGSAPGVAIDQQREMDSQLPKQVLLDYIDAGRNYNKNQESSIERLSSRAVNKESFELPLVFTPDEAAQNVQTLHDRHWLERDDFAFTLPEIYNRLESADVIIAPTPYATYEFRLTSVNYLADGRLECTAKLNDSAIYTQVAEGGTRVLGDTTISFPGATVMHLLDIPLIRDEDNKPGFAGALTGKSSGWPGGVITRSTDNGQTWNSIQGFSSHVTAGTCRDSLPAHDGYVIDRANTLQVDMYNSGLTLSSITQEQMLTGKNWFAYGVAGRWELCQYANATLETDGSYTIDTLVRGAKGTEQYTGTHVDGDLFIFLSDADAAFIAANIADIQVERLYRGVTSGKNIDTVSDTAFTYAGVNLEPLSPVQLAGTIDGSDNWDLTWLRRSRLTSSWWTTGVDAPIGEDSESYEIDIMDGSTVVRTLTSTSEAVEYTSANQVTDWGSNQTALTFRVYQLSATVGRGYVAEITL